MNKLKLMPVVTKGLAFVEFSGSKPALLRDLFSQMGLRQHEHSQRPETTLHHSGQIFFISNPCNGGNAERFRARHGRGVSAIGFRVEDGAASQQQALALGAEVAEIGDYPIPAIKGVGGSLIYLVDDRAWRELIRGFSSDLPAQTFNQLRRVDHLTHNLYQGGIARMKDFYKRIFGFEPVRHFDIEGKKTGLFSEVIASPCGNIIIPLNETKDDKSQIAEYLREYNGEGVQHIALETENIYTTVKALRAANIEFQDTPDTYYEVVDKRLPGHGESVAALHAERILIDGGERQGGGFLLQIFTKNSIGPIFFEYIQRKGNRGFGEGNFQALFESIELDQERRGVL
jgi:4-hydroxyphenylpyruvate dioxygenase